MDVELRLEHIIISYSVYVSGSVNQNRKRTTVVVRGGTRSRVKLICGDRSQNAA